jgi:hypothetical protein
MAAVAGTLAELDKTVLLRHINKNSPARRARDEEKKAKDEAKAKRRIVSRFFCLLFHFICSIPR